MIDHKDCEEVLAEWLSIFAGCVECWVSWELSSGKNVEVKMKEEDERESVCESR